MTGATQIQGTHRNIPAFNLHRPASIAEACALADNFAGRFVFMGGGVDLLQSLKSGLEVENLIFLKSVPELKTIAVQDDVLRIGACVTHRDLETDPLIAEHAPGLAGVWREIGNVRIRIAGTLGGNILSGNPGYDGLPALIALNAVAVIRDANGPHRVPALNLNGRERLGLLTAIEIPIAPSHRFLMDRSLKPVTSVALSANVSNGRITDARVGVGCAFRFPNGGPLEIADGLTLQEVAKHAESIAQEFAEALPEPMEDVFASGTYRRRMNSLLLARQLRALAED